MSYINKPWLELWPGKDNWWLASMNMIPTHKNNKKDIICYYIIQECNMGGKYYRVYTWYKYDNNRYFETMNSKNWVFNGDFINFNNNDIVLNNNNNKYKVYVKHEYIKIFELVEE